MCGCWIFLERATNWDPLLLTETSYDPPPIITFSGWFSLRFPLSADVVAGERLFPCGKWVGKVWPAELRHFLGCHNVQLSIGDKARSPLLCLAWTRGPRVICDSRSDLLPSFWIAFGVDMLSQRIVADVEYLFIAWSLMYRLYVNWAEGVECANKLSHMKRPPIQRSHMDLLEIHHLQVVIGRDHGST